jgi:hypothetical protein
MYDHMLNRLHKITPYFVLIMLFTLVAESHTPQVRIENGTVALGGEYDPDIPAPEEILGYRIGERFTDYRNLERYFLALAEASDRVHIHDYGTSYQLRPLRVLYISTPENLRNLEHIREEILLLTDPRTLSGRQAAGVIENSPVIVWLAYNVHGNEASGTEAAILTMYHLAASTDPALLAILENTVILIDPLVNPDGRERYVNFVNDVSLRSPNPDPHSVEHSEPWPRGRTNHYYFDLNRDWAWLTQQETRQRVALYRKIMPQVYVDFHEMGRESTYFFFPATPPFHPNYPEAVREWGKKFGHGNASMLDAFGIPYYTGEVFDLFYPGYGDSWPTFNGAIGMTYEQSGGSTGRAYERKDEHILTLAERAQNHFLTGISTIKTAEENRKQLLRYYYDFWLEGTGGLPGDIKSVLIKQGKDPNRTSDLVGVLLQHGIEIHRLTADKSIRNVTRYFETSPRQHLFEAGTYVINFNQPRSRLAKTLLEPHVELPDTFFFDITAWSLPAAYNVEAFTARAFVTADIQRITEPVRSDGNISGRASYAYLISWDQDKAAALLWDLLKKGYSAHFAMREFTQRGRKFPRGSIVVYTRFNDQSLHEDLAELALKHSVTVFPTDTGLSEEGIDLGSNYIRPIMYPKIAVATDLPVIATEFGELWYLFDEVYGIPFTPIRTDQIPTVDLFRYNVIILPNDGSGQGYGRIIDSTAVETLRRWIRQGGILITIGGGSQFVTKDASGLTSIVISRQPDNRDNTEDEKNRRERLKRMGFEERYEHLSRDRIAGALFRVELDTSHPLGFGYDRNITILKRSSSVLQLSERGFNVGIYAKENPVSGYAAENLVEKIVDTAYLIDYPIGEGHVVMFSDNPHFRMFWHGLTKMFLNAILFMH